MGEKGERVEQKDRKERDDRRDRDKVDRGDRTFPPAKKMRDGPRERDNRERYERDNRDKYDPRSRSAPRGGREFVRGARSRGRARPTRGASTAERGSYGPNNRGAPSGRGGPREYRGYENHAERPQHGGPRAPTYADQAKPFPMGKWGDEGEHVEEPEEIPKRRRDKDDDSDYSAEEVSSVSEESTSGKAEASGGPRHVARDASGRPDHGVKPRDYRDPNRDIRREHPHNRDMRDKGRRHDDMPDDRYGKEPRSPRGDDHFIPKGEPSRRGRGKLV